MNVKSIFLLIILLYPFILFSQTAEAGSDQEVCTNQAIMDADPAPVGFTGSWSVVSGWCIIDDVTAHNTLVTELLSGNNTLRWTITDGNITDDDLVIITNNSPTQAQTAADEAICSDEHILFANLYGPGEVGLWTLESGSGSIAVASNNSSDVTGLGAGDNTFKWTIKKGNCNSDDLLIISNLSISAEAGTDQTVCEDYTILDADDPSPAIGTWTVVASADSPIIVNPNQYNSSITNLGINTNSLKWEVDNGTCTEYDIVIITSHKPTSADAGPDQIICDDQTSMYANNPTYGDPMWSVISGTGNFENTNNYNSQITNISSGLNIYKWTIDYFGCKSEDDIEVNFISYSANAGLDDITCFDSFVLNADDPSPGTGEWRVTGGTGSFANPNLHTTEVSNLTVGENTYEWTVTQGFCIDSDYVTITRNSPSVANAGQDKETCNGISSMTAVNPAVGTGSWSIVSGSGLISNTNLNNTGISNIGKGNNVFRWTVTYLNCSDFDDVNVVNNDVIAYAGTDQIVCSNSSVLTGNEPEAGETGSWQILAGTSHIDNTIQYNSDVMQLNSGLNMFRWTIQKGSCSEFDDMEIINNLYNVTANVSGPSDICDNHTPILGSDAPPGAYAYWSISSGSGIFDNSTDKSTIVRNLALEENIVRWTVNKDGCENFAEIIINRNTVFADAGTNQNICGFETTLSAEEPIAGNIGFWSNINGNGVFENSTNHISEVTELAYGLNTFMWTVSGNGCEASDLVEVTNNYFEITAGSNTAICSNTYQLNAQDPYPGIGTWQVISGTGNFSDQTFQNSFVSGIQDLSINIYRWTVQKNGCSDFDDVTITNNLISADAGPDITVCSNDTSLDANDAVPGTGVWSIQVGGGVLENENDPQSEIYGLSYDQNIIRWTISHLTCIDYDELTITNNTVVASAGPDQEICYDFTQLAGQQPPLGQSGIWEIISGSATFQNMSLYNTQVTNLESGLNEFRWTVFKNGCSSSGDEVVINNKSFIADAGPDQELDDFVTSTFMNAFLQDGASGEWLLLSGDGSIEDIHEPQTEISGMITGINSFLWTVDHNDCSSEDIVDIIVVNFQPSAGTSKFICTDSTKLNARDENGTPQYWSIIEGTGTFDDPNLHNTWVHNVSEGLNIYRWNVTLFGATAYDDVIITRVQSHAGDDRILCEDHTFLEANEAQYGYGMWSVTGGSGDFIVPSAYNTEVVNIGNTNNLYSWTIYTEDCSSTDYVNINNDGVLADAGEDKSVYLNYVYMTAQMPYFGSTGEWTVISGNGSFINENSPSTRVNDLQLGNNTFRWTVTSDNCTDYDEVSVLYDDNSGLNLQNSRKVLVYPNPAENEIIVKTDLEQMSKISISDLNGVNVLIKEFLPIQSIRLNISALEAGIYILSIHTKTGVFQSKLVIK
jgi:hypothetical protein